MEMIKLYRYEGATHYEGSCFPGYDSRNTEWSDNKQEQIDLYNSAKIEHFNDVEVPIEEMLFNNRFRNKETEYQFFWCMLHSIEVPLKDYLKAKETGDFEDLPYIVDFDYTEIAEKGIHPNGKNMSKKFFENIVYKPYLKTNTEKGGIFKPKNIIYGNINKFA